MGNKSLMKRVTYKHSLDNIALVSPPITELEKTILLSFLLASRGKYENFVKADDIVKKFIPRQRKIVISFMRKLARNKLLEKSGDKYRLTEQGIKVAQHLLVTGARFAKFS